MRKKNIGSEEHNDGSYVVKRSRKTNILAFILCFLTAFVIWAYTMSYGDGAVTNNGDDTEQTA